MVAEASLFPEYIVMLQDDTTREQFDAVIQDARDQGEYHSL